MTMTTRRPQPTRNPWSERGPRLNYGYVVVVVAILVTLGLYPVARIIDAHEDRRIPMYQDLTAFSTAVSEWPGAERRLTTQDVDRHGVKLGSTRFKPSPGVHVRVWVGSDEYCLRAHNRYGDVARTECHAF